MSILDVKWKDHRDGDAPALAQARELSEALLSEGKGQEAQELLLEALGSVLRKSRDLELLVAKLRRERAGRRTEKVPAEQLALLLEAAAEQVEEVDLAAESKQDEELDQEVEAAKDEAVAARRGKKPGRGKKGIRTGNVKRQHHTERVPPEARTCGDCGRERNTIGHDSTTRIEYRPGEFIVHEHKLEVMACRCKNEVITAPAPLQVIPRSAATPSLLAHIVTSKFVDHCPLTRLHESYARSGGTIPVSTMADWVAQVADKLEPLWTRLSERIKGAYVVATDATGLPVLDREHSENIRRGTLWCLVGDNRDVVFRYTRTGAGKTGPWEYLKGREGYVRADASNVFDRVFNGKEAQAIELACWSHARRKLEALKDTDCRVAYPLKLISRMYRYETLADLKALEPEARSAVRRRRSAKELKKLKRFLATSIENEPPSTAFAQACTYTINHWDALTRFLKDGRLRLDNNICEQQMRAIALGRKNFLFAGSHDAAEKLATLYSLTRTCAQYGVPPMPYLTDVLTKLATDPELGTPESVDQLLPHVWRDKHPDRCSPIATMAS